MEIRPSSTTQQNSHQGNDDQVPDHVTALRLSLTEEFKQLGTLSRERSIYRVPKALRMLNENACTPRYVSIGPYHHGKDELKPMEELKTKYLHHLLQFTRVSFHEFISCVSDNETRLRDCYTERINLSTERFLRMMVVDAAFVIMVMMHNHFQRFRNEELLFDNRMITDIRRDMILLENQLPFFILDHLLVLSNLVDGFSMVRISSNFFNGMFSPWVPNPSKDLDFSDCKHLVDFFRIVQHPLELSQPKSLDVVNLPSAVELHRAGVKFKRGSSTKLLDINFHDGILEIPPLRVFPSTEILFRNLQAFEQCHFLSEQRYFNNYLFLISSLITDKKDLEILCKEGIIENRLHDKEVVHLLHNLGEENILNIENFYFADVVNDLNKYCSKRSNRLLASLVQQYLYDPWAMISAFALCILSLLTFIQTLFTVSDHERSQ